MKVSILTPTIPERAEFLDECCKSVMAQTEDAGSYEHLIERDTQQEGCSVLMNRLAARALGEWVIPFADDDLMLPGCIATLLKHAHLGDIIYSQPLMRYGASWHFFQDPPLIPSFALIRRDLWLELGGYDESARREEDRKMWVKAIERDVTFVRIEEPLWVYRLHGGNKSYNGGISS